MDNFANLAIGSVLTPPSPPSSGPSLVLKAGQGARFPAAPFQITVYKILNPATPPTAEICRVTAIVGDTLTITRAQEGTTARTIVTGDWVSNGITLKWITDLLALIGAFTVGSAAGTFAIGNGVSSGSVTGLGLAFTPTKAFIQIRRPAGGLSISAMVNDGTIGSGGFDFELSATTDSANYKLDYLLL